MSKGRLPSSRPWSLAGIRAPKAVPVCPAHGPEGSSRPDGLELPRLHVIEGGGAAFGEGVDAGARGVGEDLVGEGDLFAAAVLGVDLDGGGVDEDVQAQSVAVEFEGGALDAAEGGVEVGGTGGGAVDVDLA